MSTRAHELRTVLGGEDPLLEGVGRRVRVTAFGEVEEEREQCIHGGLVCAVVEGVDQAHLVCSPRCRDRAQSIGGGHLVLRELLLGSVYAGENLGRELWDVQCGAVAVHEERNKVTSGRDLVLDDEILFLLELLEHGHVDFESGADDGTVVALAEDVESSRAGSRDAEHHRHVEAGVADEGVNPAGVLLVHDGQRTDVASDLAFLHHRQEAAGDVFGAAECEPLVHEQSVLGGVLARVKLGPVTLEVLVVVTTRFGGQLVHQLHHLRVVVLGDEVDARLCAFHVDALQKTAPDDGVEVEYFLPGCDALSGFVPRHGIRREVRFLLLFHGKLDVVHVVVPVRDHR